MGVREFHFARTQQLDTPSPISFDLENFKCVADVISVCFNNVRARNNVQTVTVTRGKCTMASSPTASCNGRDAGASEHRDARECRQSDAGHRDVGTRNAGTHAHRDAGHRTQGRTSTGTHRDTGTRGPRERGNTGPGASGRRAHTCPKRRHQVIDRFPNSLSPIQHLSPLQRVRIEPARQTASQRWRNIRALFVLNALDRRCGDEVRRFL